MPKSTDGVDPAVKNSLDYLIMTALNVDLYNLFCKTEINLTFLFIA